MSSDAYLIVSECNGKGSLGRIPPGGAETPWKGVQVGMGLEGDAIYMPMS